MNIKLAGCVLLDKKGYIGLLHRYVGGADQWELPGGKIDLGEDAKQAAARELSEELGVTVSIVRQLGGASFEYNNQTFDCKWFLGDIAEQKPSVKEPDLFDDFAFFDVKDLAGLQLSGNMQNLFREIKNGSIKL